MKTSTIENDTPILPEVIADMVCREVATLIPCLDQPVASLAARAERHYSANAHFASRVRSRHGREYLASFMRHWLAAELVKSGYRHEDLPTGFANGLAPEPRHTEERCWFSASKEHDLEQKTIDT